MKCWSVSWRCREWFIGMLCVCLMFLRWVWSGCLWVVVLCWSVLWRLCNCLVICLLSLCRKCWCLCCVCVCWLRCRRCCLCWMRNCCLLLFVWLIIGLCRILCWFIGLCRLSVWNICWCLIGWMWLCCCLVIGFVCVLCVILIGCWVVWFVVIFMCMCLMIFLVVVLMVWVRWWCFCRGCWLMWLLWNLNRNCGGLLVRLWCCMLSCCLCCLGRSMVWFCWLWNGFGSWLDFMCCGVMGDVVLNIWVFLESYVKWWFIVINIIICYE